MTDDDARQLYKMACRRLRAPKVYNVLGLQDGLGINAMTILEAVRAGDIPRSLSCGLDTCVLGNDVIDWLRARAHNGRLPYTRHVATDSDE